MRQDRDPEWMGWALVALMVCVCAFMYLYVGGELSWRRQG